MKFKKHRKKQKKPQKTNKTPQKSQIKTDPFCLKNPRGFSIFQP